MATGKDKASDILGYKSVMGLAGSSGLIGGVLFGIWDSITVIIDRSPPALSEMLALSLYSVAIYTVIGCLGMTVIGAFSGFVIRAGRYHVNKSQLARVFIGVFVLLAVSILLAEMIMSGNIIDITESTVIGILSGVGVAGLSIYSLSYVLSKGIRTEKLIALCISLFVSLLVFLYGGLLVNIKLVPGQKFYQPISLLSDFGLLILVCLMAVGIYVVSLSILQRFGLRSTRRAGYILLSVILCAFIAISSIGPFSAKASQHSTLVNPGNLEGKPNILWIVMDTVRADHLSSYGYYRNTTPNIDRIASEGTLFENAMATAPWTLPSHASMFTGTFPAKHGTDRDHLWLDDDFQTIAEVLRMNGYKTFARSNNVFAASHDHNSHRGFSTFEVSWYGWFVAGSELTDFLKFSKLKREVQNNLVIDDGAYRTNKVVKRWIADAYQAGIPFFGFINYMEAHEPYDPPRDYVMPYLEKNVDLAEAMRVNQVANNYVSGKVQMNDDDFETLSALYDGEISYLDFRMGQLFDYLRELNILDNTVLIITSDHGENFGEHHLMGHHFCVYDTLLHVPLIIRYPESVKAGLRVNEQVQLTDIFPTILDIVGIDWDGKEQIQGYSLLEDREQDGSTFTIAEYVSGGLNLRDNIRSDLAKYNRRLRTVRTNEYKYIWASDGRDELYNIRNDPGELDNLINAEPEKASEMRAQLKKWLESFEPYRPGAVQQMR
ncbi:sulfatase-like hydrolase/transferase [Chloroflexota bacterium]